MVGSAIVRRLQTEDCEVILSDRATLDLTDADTVERFLKDRRPDAVFMAAAKVGGIHANRTYPVEFLMQNLAIAQSTITGSFKAGVQKLLFLGSSCISPRLSPQPIQEEYLLTGSLEPTNEWSTREDQRDQNVRSL